MQASIQFVGWNFEDVKMWCDFYCIPIVAVYHNDNKEVEAFEIKTDGGLLTIYKGDIIEFEQTAETFKIGKTFFPNYD